MGRLGRLIIRGRWAFLGCFAVILFGAGQLLPGLGFSFSLMPLLQADEDVQAEVSAFQAAVPPRLHDQIFSLEFPRIMRGRELEVVHTLVGRLEKDSRVSRVVSLPRMPVVSNVGGLPVPRPFRTTVTENETVLAAAERHPLLLRRLISDDGHATALLLTGTRDDQVSKAAMLDWLEIEVNDHVGPEVVVRFIGDEVSKRAMKKYMSEDLKRGLLLELLVFAILLPLIFRTARGIIIPLAVVVSAQMLCLSLLVLAGMDIGLIDLAVPGIITMITVCDAVHMIHKFEESLVAGNDKRAAIIDMMRSIGPACFFTSLTTAIGFLSLLVARHPAVRMFGVKASIAVLIAFLAIVTMIPTLLAFWPVKRGVLAKIPGFGGYRYGRRKLTLTLFAVVLASALLGISKLNVDAHWLEEMPDQEPLIQDLKWYEEHFSGIMSLDIKLSGALDNPEVFAAVEKLQTRLLKEDGINKAESYTHWIREALNRQEGPLTGADIRRGLEWLKLSGTFFPIHAINPDLSIGRITFLTDDDGTSRFFEIRNLVDRLNRELPEGVDAEVAGFMEMAHEASRLIVTTMLESFIVSLLVISLLIAAIFRSFRMGLVSIIPNVFPILVALGMNGWLDINLRIGIVMIYSLGLGLAVDDTIHLITRFRQERKRDPAGDPRGQIVKALKGCGPALVTTSIVLAIGSLSYLPSNFRSLRDVGLLLTMIVVTAVLADLLVLPHLLEMAGKKKSRS